MGATADRYRRLRGTEAGSAMERVVFFSDAVFAIAMTLLVIELRIPDGVDTAEGLVELLPAILAYVISFAVVGINWMAHHRKFLFITGVDGGLIWLNMLLLLLIAFVPFPTSLLSRGEGDTPLAAVILYAAIVAAISLVQHSMWIYAHRHGVLDARIDDQIYRMVRLDILTTPVIFLISIPVALIHSSWGMYTWLLLIPASMFSGRWEPKARVGALAHPSVEVEAELPKE